MSPFVLRTLQTRRPLDDSHRQFQTADHFWVDDLRLCDPKIEAHSTPLNQGIRIEDLAMRRDTTFREPFGLPASIRKPHTNLKQLRLTSSREYSDGFTVDN